MIIFKEANALHQHIESKKKQGFSIGFVPTMGALHKGHISLIKESSVQCDITVCSIFVNPTQFNDPNDFAKYPITIDKDILLLEENNTSILFLPSVKEIYPQGTVLKKNYQLGYLETILEGAYRPGHFQGVCQVVQRLLEIVVPDKLFMGQKDYQQCMVLKKMMADVGIRTTMVILPIHREASGLAMSSRNVRLSKEGLLKATVISKILLDIKEKIKPGELTTICTKAKEKLLSAGFEKVDYVSIANAATLELIEYWDGKTPLVALVAATIDGVRLIDNLLLS